jgi:radical SAM superfamily enzyme YgiQ (UPF0313 family)
MTDPRPTPAVVLTADRTLMARFPTLFDGMVCGSQTTTTPAPLVRCLLAPPVGRDGLRARQAPLGLRRIEAALVRDGWDAAEVAVVRPEELPQALGPRTRIVGLSSGDPLGLGMNSNTMTAIAGGRIHTSRAFQRLARRLAEKLRRLAPQARVVVGGPGAWQLAADDAARRAFGVDHVITGYCEANAADLFRRLADGDSLPPVLEGECPAADGVPPIRGASVMGSVELSRGCGLGCQFCSLARTPMVHLPADTIVADAQTNLAAGVTSVALIGEDVFRYGACATAGSSSRVLLPHGRTSRPWHPPRVNPPALLSLLGRLRELPGLRLLQTDHANVASAAQFTDDELREVHRLFVGEGRHDFVWLNLGIETASGELLAANGGRAKMAPWPPAEWGDACLDQLRRLVRAGFFPLVSLVFGLPGETADDLERTARWVDQLRGERLAIFPLLYAPLDGRGPALGRAEMSPAHWRLLRACYRLNFRWVPQLVWDNQAGAGVGLARRLLLQALGRGQMVWWKSLFAWRSRRRASDR